MGFTIFTSSGTFNPADYGLKVGDNLHIVCVGGGGGGSTWAKGTQMGWQWTGNAGSAGGASSFGSYVTASGGLGGTVTKNTDGSSYATYEAMPNSQVEYSNRGGRGASMSYIGTYGSSYASRIVFSGGAGGDGWLPGVFTGTSYLTTAELLYNLYNPLSSDNSRNIDYPSNFSYRPIKYVHVNNSYVIGEYAAQTGLRGGYGGFGSLNNTSGNYFGFPGAPGVGYGAGGGGAVNDLYCAAGGNGGQIIHKDIALTSTSGISVTIGNGGVGGYDSYLNQHNCLYNCGGGGARGCVAVYW